MMALTPRSRLQLSLRSLERVDDGSGGPYFTRQDHGKMKAKRVPVPLHYLEMCAVHPEMGYLLDTNQFINAIIHHQHYI